MPRVIPTHASSAFKRAISACSKLKGLDVASANRTAEPSHPSVHGSCGCSYQPRLGEISRLSQSINTMCSMPKVFAFDQLICPTSICPKALAAMAVGPARLCTCGEPDETMDALA